MNNFSISGIVSLTPATHALLADITNITGLPAVMTAEALASTIERCRSMDSTLESRDRDLLREILADLEPLTAPAGRQASD